jgi:yecA family protein
MKTLPVRVLDLARALEEHDREFSTYYFDSRTGEIVFLTEDGRGSDKRWDIISNSVARFIEIEPMDSHQGYHIMERFVATLPPSPLQEKLKSCLEGAGPFRRFRDTLVEDQNIRKRWFEFHHEAMQKIALEWLADHDIEPTERNSPVLPSLLDQEAEALAAKEAEQDSDDHDEVSEDEFDSDTEELEDFDEEDEGEPVDFLSEDEEAVLADFVESLPGAEFNIAKLHGLFSAFAAGPLAIDPAGLMNVVTGFAKGKIDSADSPTMFDLLGRFYGDIVEQLEFEGFEPRFQQKGVMVTDPNRRLISWCNGFMLGINHQKEAWKPWFKEIRRAKAISLIAGMSDPEILRQAENALGEDTVLATANMIGELVPLIRQYWAFEFALDQYIGFADG